MENFGLTISMEAAAILTLESMRGTTWSAFVSTVKAPRKYCGDWRKLESQERDVKNHLDEKEVRYDE